MSDQVCNRFSCFSFFKIYLRFLRERDFLASKKKWNILCNRNKYFSTQENNDIFHILIRLCDFKGTVVNRALPIMEKYRRPQFCDSYCTWHFFSIHLQLLNSSLSSQSTMTRYFVKNFKTYSRLGIWKMVKKIAKCCLVPTGWNVYALIRNNLE